MAKRVKPVEAEETTTTEEETAVEPVLEPTEPSKDKVKPVRFKKYHEFLELNPNHVPEVGEHLKPEFN